MRDDASRARLVEMGFELFVARDVRGVATPSAEPVVARRRVALVARDGSASARALLAQVKRALAFARLDATPAPDPSAVGDAGGMVVFGAALAREIGAPLPNGRTRSLEWVGTGEPAEIAGKGGAKRALWGELKRLARALANG